MSEQTSKKTVEETVPAESMITDSSKALDAVLKEETKVIRRLNTDTLLIKEEKYKIKENYREALDLELLEERYSDFLEKYDFIVGDMSYGKLRLRGFYHDNDRKAPIDMRISSLEDYLSEYCSFGCAYFVLENLEPNKKKQNRQTYEKDDSYQSKETKSKTDKNKNRPQPKKRKPASSNRQDRRPAKGRDDKRSFVKKNRQDQLTNVKNTKKEDDRKTESVKHVKNEKGKTRFQVRKTID